MANSNNKQSGGFISNAFGVAKKLSTTGLSVLNHVAPGTVAKITQAPQDHQVVQGVAREKGGFEKKSYDNPQQMIREQLPKLSSQLLGRHYKKVNNVASFISPDLNDKLADYFFDKLNDFVSESSSVDALLKEVGVKDLSALANDPARSQRISQALANQNKIIAAVQGTLTGTTGVIGSAIDVPTSIALALRSIYQTGRAHGFELSHKDQDVVEFIFKQIDLGSVAEKQALLMAVRTVANVMQTHNVDQLQQLLGSANDAELIKKWISNEDGSFKWSWLNGLPKLGLFSKLTPLATIGISAVYSWKLVDDATDKAQVVFLTARQYLIEHPDQKIDALTAYEKVGQFLAQTSPLSLQDVKAEQVLPPVISEQAIDKGANADLKLEQNKQAEITELSTPTEIDQSVKTLTDKNIKEPVQNVDQTVQSKVEASTQGEPSTETAEGQAQKDAPAKEGVQNVAQPDVAQDKTVVDEPKTATKKRTPRKASTPTVTKVTKNQEK